MAKAYLNALAEEGTRDDLIKWLVKLDAENDKLREKVARLEGKIQQALCSAGICT